MSGRGNVRSGKCPSGEMSSRGSVLRGSVRSGKCPFGEMSVGELSSGKCQSGNCPHTVLNTLLQTENDFSQNRNIRVTLN